MVATELLAPMKTELCFFSALLEENPTLPSPKRRE
jgi:hypothetical protein